MICSNIFGKAATNTVPKKSDIEVTFSDARLARKPMARRQSIKFSAQKFLLKGKNPRWADGETTKTLLML